MMVLYHLNMGYPLLDQDAQLFINSTKVVGRTPLAQSEIDKWSVVEKPQMGYQERCYYHSFDQEGIAAIFQPKLDLGLAIHFNSQQLPFFCQWKQMGYRDYALGLEPGNAHCDGRDKMRQSGMLRELQPFEEADFAIEVEMLANSSQFMSLQY